MNLKTQLEVIRRGAVEIINEEELERKLSAGRPLLGPLSTMAGSLRSGRSVVAVRSRLVLVRRSGLAAVAEEKQYRMPKPRQVPGRPASLSLSNFRSQYRRRLYRICADQHR